MVNRSSLLGESEKELLVNRKANQNHLVRGQGRFDGEFLLDFSLYAKEAMLCIHDDVGIVRMLGGKAWVQGERMVRTLVC
ncbi:hypothetical protein VNO77_35219 [Canavalia gladiata]|uniref:Uncharacterized protein n=1 Tax=Canavalia gladiata TaxID=3824 RepID=A0AAN9KG98_CANGL